MQGITRERSRSAKTQSEQFTISQAAFSGTLQELGTELRSGRLEPSRVNLLQLVRSWLGYFDSLAMTDLGQASAALPAVAQVIELKLRLLLPRPPRELEEDLTEILETVALLEGLEDAIEFLRQRREERRVLLPASAPRPEMQRREQNGQLPAATLGELASRLKSHSYFEIAPDQLSLTEAGRQIRQRLAAGKQLTLTELAGRDWPALTVFLAALLELLREGRACATQEEPFNEIIVWPAKLGGPHDSGASQPD